MFFSAIESFIYKLNHSFITQKTLIHSETNLVKMLKYFHRTRPYTQSYYKLGICSQR